MAEVFYISARIIQVEVFVPRMDCVAKLRKAFDREFPDLIESHSGRGDRGGYSIVSATESYIRFVVDEKEESRLIGFLQDFANEEGFEFSTMGR